MENKDKSEKTVLQEAVIELQEILEAANSRAKNKLTKDFPEKFEKILKEELERLKTNKDSDKENIKESEKKDKNVVKESNDTKKDSNKEKITESVDLRKKEMPVVENTFDNAQLDDLFEVNDGDDINIDDIENELNQMEQMANEMQEVNNSKNDPFEKLKNLHKQIGEMVAEMETQQMDGEYKKEFDSKMIEMYGEGYDQVLGEEKCNELYSTFAARKKGDPFKKNEISENMESSINEMDDEFEIEMDDEFEIEMDDDQISDDELGFDLDDDLLDEIHGHMLSKNKRTDGHLLPRPEYGAEYKTNRLRNAVRNNFGESYTKKIKGFIQENKKLFNELNSLKSNVNESTELIGKYETVLNKYRTQLSEMALFNTNLANVNNILLNENLNLTTEEKVNIINEFKKIKSIEESEKKYNSILNENKDNKKEKINESKSVDVVIGSSSKNLIEESTVNNFNNPHIDKIKRVINYVENRKNK